MSHTKAFVLCLLLVASIATVDGKKGKPDRRGGKLDWKKGCEGGERSVDFKQKGNNIVIVLVNINNNNNNNNNNGGPTTIPPASLTPAPTPAPTRPPTSAAPTKPPSNVIEFKFDTAGFPRFRLTFNDNNGTAYTYRLGLLRVFEFIDSGTIAGAYDGADRIVSSLSLRNNQWSPVTISQDKADGKTIYKMNTETQTPQGKVALILRTAPQFVAAEGTVVAPNKLKFDVVLTDYKYVGNGTYVAIDAVLQSDSAIRVNEFENGGEAQTNSDNDFGAFSWVNNVVTDYTAEREVTATFTELDAREYTNVNGDDDTRVQEISTTMAFAFDTRDRPSRIVWDPDLGTLSNQNGVSGVGPSIVSFVLVLAAWFGRM